MIERTTEHTWKMANEEDETIFTITAISGVKDISINVIGVDTLEEWQEFHQALGEAIAEAEK